jgi:two-component system response regulator YesN
MLNVMLVDDDYPVLDYLRQTIPWESLGMKVQGFFENGVKALEAVKVEPPDILITDIGMPHMNGLELIEKAKELHPQIKVAILSCHNEFAFAQQAVKLHVDDYILKETMQPQSIIQMLRKLAVQLDESRSENLKVERLQQITKESQSALMDKFLRTLLYYPLLFPEQLMEQAKDYGIVLSSFAYLPVICFIDRYEVTRKRFYSEDNLMFAVQNVIEELTRESEKTVIFRLSRKQLLLLFPIQPMNLSCNGIGEAEAMLKEIQRSLRQYIRVGVTFLMGKHGQDLKSLRERILELIQSSEEARFYSVSGVIARYQPAKYSEEDFFTHYSTAFDQLKQVVMEQASDQVDRVSKQWIEHIAREQYHPRIAKEWFLKLMLDLQFKFKSLQNFQSDYSLEVLHQTILEAETLEQLRELIVSFLHRTFPVMEQIYRQPKRKEITEAQQYVIRSMNRRVTQEEVAEYLHLNPSYFSRLFKKETSENFVEFVTRTKMEKAKELIDQTACTVEELADMLGYDNKSYFLKCFKNFTGLTPSEYAGKMKRGKPIKT